MKRRRLIVLSALVAAALAIFVVWREVWRERKFSSHINAAAKRYGVDPLLVRAIVWRESRFNPEARGRHGELGLMQIQEIAAQEWADDERDRAFDHSHCFNPATNALAGTFYLSRLLKRYTQTDDAIPYALADYNAGRGNVLKWNSGAAATNSTAFIAQIGFPKTKTYVMSVMRRRELYRLLVRFGWNP